LDKLNPTQLLHLDIRNNLSPGSYYDDDYFVRHKINYGHGSYGSQIQAQDFNLFSFSNFKKLEVLMLGNEFSGYNDKRCRGSFESLKGLNNLKRLSIRNSDITDDLEYLPESLTKFFDYSGCSKIEKQLGPFQ